MDLHGLEQHASTVAKLGRGFGQDVHAADLGCDPELGPVLFHTHHGRLAADPAFFSIGELGRQDQNQLDLGSLLHAGLGIEEDAVGAHVSGLDGFIAADGCVLGVNTAQPSGHAGRDSGSGAAFGVSGHGAETNHSTPCCQAGRESRSGIASIGFVLGHYLPE